MSEKVGFIGMGIMGAGMARNLIDDGFDVRIWNRTSSRMEPLIEAGASPADSPADVARRCDIIMICVSDTPDVQEVVLGEFGVVEGVEPGALVVDHSTISPSATLELAKAVEERGAHWLDAPISGGSEGAVKGTLAIMVGGDEAQVERARPFMEAYGNTITHVGGQGAGQMVKLVNQILVVINGLAVAEALIFAQAAGLDLVKTVKAVEGGGAGSWMLSNRGPQMIERDWRPGFMIDLQQKDLRLVLESADEIGVPTPTTALVFQMYRALQHQGLGAEGNHALVKALEQMAGITVGEG
ncbi:MAG TPA: NAD(P)-dependent oxidoreductase [Actinobacteria bacterium]|nr:NAD(P)-dependent oxidoreductase [Actinomycetota bacterium]